MIVKKFVTRLGTEVYLIQWDFGYVVETLSIYGVYTVFDDFCTLHDALKFYKNIN